MTRPPPGWCGRSRTPGPSWPAKTRRKRCSKKPSGSRSTPHRGTAPGWTWPTDPGYGGTGGSPSHVGRWCPHKRSLTLWGPPPGQRERCRNSPPPAGEPGNTSPMPGRSCRLRSCKSSSWRPQGLTNREIGERLYLSHRTVGSHLYRAFPKLGVRSRSQLHLALVAQRPFSLSQDRHARATSPVAGIDCQRMASVGEFQQLGRGLANTLLFTR